MSETFKSKVIIGFTFPLILIFLMAFGKRKKKGSLDFFIYFGGNWHTVVAVPVSLVSILTINCHYI